MGYYFRYSKEGKKGRQALACDDHEFCALNFIEVFLAPLDVPPFSTGAKKSEKM